MLIILPNHVIGANEMVKFQKGKNSPWILFWWLRYLIFGVLNLWECLWVLMGWGMFLWKFITCWNGWKQLRLLIMNEKVSPHSWKKNIFSRFGTPRVIICYSGSHFCNKFFKGILKKYGVHHNVATPHYQQTSRQVEVSNREIKKILMKMLNTNRKYWSRRPYDSLWAYHIT